jgi:hypothetical protein
VPAETLLLGEPLGAAGLVGLEELAQTDRHLYRDVEGDEENLTDEMSISSWVSAEVKGMIERRQHRAEGGGCFRV